MESRVVPAARQCSGAWCVPRPVEEPDTSHRASHKSERWINPDAVPARTGYPVHNGRRNCFMYKLVVCRKNICNMA